MESRRDSPEWIGEVARWARRLAERLGAAPAGLRRALLALARVQSRPWSARLGGAKPLAMPRVALAWLARVEWPEGGPRAAADPRVASAVFPRAQPFGETLLAARSSPVAVTGAGAPETPKGASPSSPRRTRGSLERPPRLGDPSHLPVGLARVDKGPRPETPPAGPRPSTILLPAPRGVALPSPVPGIAPRRGRAPEGAAPPGGRSIPTGARAPEGPTALAKLVTVGRPGDARTAPGALRSAEPRVAPARESARGLDLHSLLSLPPRLARNGLDWLATASRGVRVHTDGTADRLTRERSADAVTSGTDVYVRGGRFDPASPRGLALLSHELVHVLQHREGGAAPVGPAGACDRHEREAMAVEKTVLQLLQPSGAARGRLSPASPLAQGSLRAAAGPPPSRPPLTFRAPEDRPLETAPPAAGPSAAADPAELARDVYRLLERRLRVERERSGLGRA